MAYRSARIVAAVLVGACAACGTTVQAGSAAGTGPSQPGEAGAQAPSGGRMDAVGLAGPSTAGTQAEGPARGAAANAAARTATTAATAAGAGGKPRLAVKGVTATEVLIGYSTSKALNGVAGSLGLKGVDAGDTQAQVEAVVKDLNARGGLLGHRIGLVPYDVSTSSNAQAMCSAWTQDTPVFAVVDAVNAGAPVLDDTLAACLNNAHVPLLTGAPLISRLTFARYPFLIAPGHAASERYMSGLVSMLLRESFFVGWDPTLGAQGQQPVKIGINSFDTPGDQSRVRALVRALQESGYSDIDVVKHPSDPSGLAASTQNAVLRFKSEGVTHVFGASVLFYQDANSQAYRPHYAVDDSANTVQLMAQNAPKAQLHGSVGAGYLPMSEDDSYTSGTAAAAACLQIMRRAGLDTTNRFATTYMLAICDRFWVLQRALAAAGTLTPEGVLQGLGRLPAGLDSAGTYAMTLDERHHDGAFRLRGFRYVDSCSCFRLAGPTAPF